MFERVKRWRRPSPSSTTTFADVLTDDAQFTCEHCHYTQSPDGTFDLENAIEFRLTCPDCGWTHSAKDPDAPLPAP